mmetsp:Transcript_30720/g.59919  ORF Transcript_30720/g.59919 Transcript_30720/m.59919 type:complete len:227 (-) Transcript_30720:629-1309(-)
MNGKVHAFHDINHPLDRQLVLWSGNYSKIGNSSIFTNRRKVEISHLRIFRRIFALKINDGLFHCSRVLVPHLNQQPFHSTLPRHNQIMRVPHEFRNNAVKSSLLNGGKHRLRLAIDIRCVATKSKILLSKQTALLLTITKPIFVFIVEQNAQPRNKLFLEGVRKLNCEIPRGSIIRQNAAWRPFPSTVEEVQRSGGRSLSIIFVHPQLHPLLWCSVRLVIVKQLKR